MDRKSQQYQQLKLYWEFVASPYWKELIKPLLVDRSPSNYPSMDTFNGMIGAARVQAKQQLLEGLISDIERKAEQFTKISVEQ